MSEGSGTSSGKIVPSWSCFCTFSNLGGRGGGRGLLSSLAWAPPVRTVRLSRAFVFPGNFRASLLLSSENLLTATEQAQPMGRFRENRLLNRAGGDVYAVGFSGFILRVHAAS